MSKLSANVFFLKVNYSFNYNIVSMKLSSLAYVHKEGSHIYIQINYSIHRTKTPKCI